MLEGFFSPRPKRCAAGATQDFETPSQSIMQGKPWRASIGEDEMRQQIQLYVAIGMPGFLFFIFKTLAFYWY